MIYLTTLWYFRPGCTYRAIILFEKLLAATFCLLVYPRITEAHSPDIPNAQWSSVGDVR
jgi:hypothetical protein